MAKVEFKRRMIAAAWGEVAIIRNEGNEIADFQERCRRDPAFRAAWLAEMKAAQK
jgi:hypothetical protein